MNEKLQTLRNGVKNNLENVIMPFWKTYMTDEAHGGFYGKVTGDLRPDTASPKSVVLNTRLLWYYSRMFGIYGDAEYESLARRAYEYIADRFWDRECGGVFWLVNSEGLPLEIEKRTYGQAFIIYGMSEYYRVFGEARALSMAEQTFGLLEDRAKCPFGGYYDSVSRDWSQDAFVRRWAMNAGGTPKVLNSQMHLLEAYTALLRAHESARLRGVLGEYLAYFMERGFDWEIMHFKAGMDEKSDRTDDDISFGHDCECSYLINDAAAILGDPVLKRRAADITKNMMYRVCAEGLDPVNGGIYYEKYFRTGAVNRCKVWWTQAEAMTGMLDACEVTGDGVFADAAINIWNYVESNMVDYANGEWLAFGDDRTSAGCDRALEEMTKSRVGDPYVKASRTKCPYHNGKACLEAMRRIDRLMSGEGK